MRVIVPQSRFSGGLSFSEKEGPRSSFLFARSVDYRSDPTKLKILPRTTKNSGSTVTDLIMDADRQDTDLYSYGDSGNIYTKDSSDVWTNVRTAPDSHGNGIKYFGEDLYLYYTSDAVIGRYGPFGGTKSWNDDFLGSFGGVPLNTHSLTLNGTTQYATAADSASLSITGDITIEGYYKIDTLPAAAASISFVSKWNESGNQRSYLFDLLGVSGAFGDGSDGALTISSDTTHAPTDSAATGTAATYSLSATNASFATGQKIMIHQSRGTNAGVWEPNEIASYTAGTITTTSPVTNTYTSGAQVLVLAEYTNVTVNSGKTWTAKAWNGTVGGILAFLANGTVTGTGTITASQKGFRGWGESSYPGARGDGVRGEGTAGEGGDSLYTANGNGGGSRTDQSQECAGGGGGNGTAGGSGQLGLTSPRQNEGGQISGSADLTLLTFGGAGGSLANPANSPVSPVAGFGGGIINISGATITISGGITSNGGNGTASGRSATGAGAGGSILLKTQTGTLGTTLVTATGGSAASGTAWTSGYGGAGRIHLDYYTSYTGTTNPTLDATLDQTLVGNTSYQMRLQVSSTGTNEESLAYTLPSVPNTAQWYRFAVAWDASASTAYFYIDGVLQGQAVGTLTAIYNSTALAAIGASFDSGGTAENFFDGKVDDIRIWNDIRTATELFANKDYEISGSSPNLQAYWEVDNALTDTTANANTLTLVASPSYDATDVPFPSYTTRLDLDQSLDSSGQTETLPTAISETATDRQTFVPTKDPTKSIEVNINTVGTGDWTMTVHDALNREVASVTVTNAELHTSDYEFEFATPWRPVRDASYHFHLTSTTTDGVVVTGTANDLETADFHTYFQFLVDDDFHPIEQILNILAIGNERYLATWDGVTYTPHKLALPSGYRIRCLGRWREYLAIGTTRGTNIEDYDQGKIFFWDGTSTTYNFAVDVLEGGVNAMVSGDPLYFMAGYSLDLCKYEGGRPRKIRRIPFIGNVKAEVNPHAMAMWRALLHIGIAEDSTSTDIYRGIYAWGTLHQDIEESLSFDYPTSTSITQNANLEIGMVFPVGSELYISWRYLTSYGVDKVALSNSPFATATIEFLIRDLNKIWAEKQANYLRGYFKAIVSGDTYKIKYKVDRATGWLESSLVDTADVKEVRLQLPTKGNRFNEIQVAVDISTSNQVSPEFFGFGIDVSDLREEKRL